MLAKVAFVIGATALVVFALVATKEALSPYMGPALAGGATIVIFIFTMALVSKIVSRP